MVFSLELLRDDDAPINRRRGFSNAFQPILDLQDARKRFGIGGTIPIRTLRQDQCPQGARRTYFCLQKDSAQENPEYGQRRFLGAKVPKSILRKDLAEHFERLVQAALCGVNEYVSTLLGEPPYPIFSLNDYRRLIHPETRRLFPFFPREMVRKFNRLMQEVSTWEYADVVRLLSANQPKWTLPQDTLFSHIKPDGFLPMPKHPVVIEAKLFSKDGGELHKIGLAMYALFLEQEYRREIDTCVVLSTNGGQRLEIFELDLEDGVAQVFDNMEAIREVVFRAVVKADLEVEAGKKLPKLDTWKGLVKFEAPPGTAPTAEQRAAGPCVGCGYRGECFGG